MKHPPKGHFYYMVVAQIMYSLPPEKEGDEPGIGAAPVNCVMWSDQDRIPVAGLGRAQQLAQMNFFKKVPDPTQITIHDVIIMNMISLGRFTEEEFNRAPQATDEDKAAVLAALGGGLKAN